jgi:penicillin-binding protein 2
MPTRAWYSRRYKGDGFRGGFTLLAAIGQGATTVTVMQLALAYAALANDGTLYQPQIVRSIETSSGTTVQEFPPRVRRIIDVNPEHLALIKQALRGVVNNPLGTAYKESIEGVDVAGKTGTAQVSHFSSRGVKDPRRDWYENRDHAWFAGYAPAKSPEIAIVVLVEHGGGGGKNAAPIAMRVVDDWQKLSKRRLASRGSDGRTEGASL